MNAKFIVNDYALIWNLIFQASSSESIYKLKQKLGETYKKQYNITYKDKELILQDPKNFIPTDDTIYNILLESKFYDKIKKQVDKYRLEVMKLWDKNKKETDKLYNEIIRKEYPEYKIFIVNKELNTIDNSVNGSLIFGKKIDKDNPLNTLLEINTAIIVTNLKRYNEKDVLFMKAIIELAILNEYATNINKRSYYISGNPKLLTLKRYLYPYWLMYLGIPKKDFKTYMERDKVFFSEDKYPYEKELKKMNIEEFIDYCINNQENIMKEEKTELI